MAPLGHSAVLYKKVLEAISKPNDTLVEIAKNVRHQGAPTDHDTFRTSTLMPAHFLYLTCVGWSGFGIASSIENAMFIIYLTLIALLVGSFLNMLIDRLHTKEQIIGLSRSHCDTCGHILGVRDLVPIVSWLMLRGKCRYCGAPIPARNALVELVTAALVVLTYVELFESNLLSIEEIPVFVLVTIILCALLVLLVFDVYHQILPDSVMVVALLATIGLHGFFFVENGILFGNISFMNSMLSAFGSALPYFILILMTKGAGMGGGDLKLAFVMGLLLGYPKIFVAQYIAFILGGIVAIVLLMGGKKRFGQTMAFGPFMIIGTCSVLFWGDEIIKRFAYWIP